MRIADHLVTNHKQVIKDHKPALITRILALIQWFTKQEYIDPVIYLQELLRNKPDLDRLTCGPPAKRLQVTVEPRQSQVPWFNVVHYGQMIGKNIDDSMQWLLNAIHFNKLDGRQAYIVVFLTENELNVFSSSAAYGLTIQTTRENLSGQINRLPKDSKLTVKGFVNMTWHTVTIKVIDEAI